MRAEIITIGDEILIGQIVDTNSAFIAKELNKIGVDVYQITSIQDDRIHILNALENAASRVDLVLITGGLGPTKDDITKNTLAEYFNDSLRENNTVLAHVEKLFKEYVDDPISQINRDQALVPSKAEALLNQYGTAPAMWFDENEVVYVSMPGVPFEMKALMTDVVIPKVAKRFKRAHILHKTLLTYGMGESALAEKIETWENELPSFIKLAYLPNLGSVRLRLSARGEDQQVLQDEIDRQIEKLKPLIGDVIRGVEGEGSMEEQVARQLTKQHKTLATAESCTGGQLAALFTAIPGASAYFKGSVVTYATSAKNDVLQIPQEIIEKYSVVSAEITKEMAQHTQRLFRSDYAIATTGNAGPTKGDSDAEIGTVFIAIAASEEIYVKEFNFGNKREKVTGKAVNKALEMLLDEVSK